MRPGAQAVASGMVAVSISWHLGPKNHTYHNGRIFNFFLKKNLNHERKKIRVYIILTAKQSFPYLYFIYIIYIYIYMYIYTLHSVYILVFGGAGARKG